MSYFEPLSFWEADAFFSAVDVAIVGGGIVGMNAALRLIAKDPSLRITILDRASIGTAASSRNAGFACYGSPSEIYADLQSMTEEAVMDLVKKRVDGLKLLRETIGDKALHYQKTGGHEVFLEEASFQEHLDVLDRINALVGDVDSGLKFYHSKDNQNIHHVAGVISNDWEGQIHPGLMTLLLRELCIKEGIKILTNFHIDDIQEGNGFQLTHGNMSLCAKKVIVTTNGFAKQLLDVETTPGRNQVLITKPIPGLKLKGCFHYDRGYVYFRNVDQRILIGGGRNRDLSTETTDQFGQTSQIRDYLIELLQYHILPGQEVDVDREWSGILGFNNTKEPIIKEIKKDYFVAVGLGGMGVAIGSLVGQEVADLLLQS